MISLSLVLLLVGFNAGAQDDTSRRIDSLVRESQFIFQGTVVKLNATTMPSTLPATDTTVVVKVDEVIDAPQSLGNFAGQEITVGLAKNSPVRGGQRLVFFTKSWLYGQSLAVNEVGRLDARNTPEISRRVAEARQMIFDENLSRRLARAEVVVLGTVTLIRPARERRRPTRITEHEPDWWEAVIEVESVLKGTLQQRANVVVLYPNSSDVMWFGTPKFARGQRGIFLLHRTDAEFQRQFEIQGFTALDPLDFQPPTEADRIKRLAANPR